MRNGSAESSARSRRAAPWTARLLLSLSAILCAGCASVTAPIVADTAPLCRALARPVCINSDDKLTDATARDILRVNEGIRGGCPGVAQPCPKGQKAAAGTS